MLFSATELVHFSIRRGLRINSKAHSILFGSLFGSAGCLPHTHTHRHVKPERLGIDEAQKPLSLCRPPAVVPSEPEQV